MVVCASFFCVSVLAARYDFDKMSTLAKVRYGEEARQDVLQLQKLVFELQSEPEMDRLRKINTFFNNKIVYAEDISIWGRSDYWASPLESIGRQAGDCEDFSIAKYVFLRAADIPNDKLRLTYVKARVGNQIQTSVAHLVLSYYETPQSEPLILDNLNPDILPASKRTDLTPIFSFNDKSIWAGSNEKPRANAQSHLSRWSEVLLRMKLDGVDGA